MDLLLGWVPQEVWAGLDTFWLALSLWPWFVAVALVSLVLGAWLGPAKTAVLLTAGVALIWLANRRDDEPIENRGSMRPGDASPSPRRKPKTAKRTKEWKPPESLSGT